MKDYQIYLCGGMGKFGKENFEESDVWRRYCKDTLESFESKRYKVSCINPNDYFSFVQDPPLYESNREVMELDLNKLRNSDLVIANFNDPSSLGSMAELAIAYDNRIPIVGLNVSNEELHPWEECMCNRIFDDIDELLDYVEDFYLT